MFQRQLIQTLAEDVFDTFVTDVVKMQRPETGVFQPDRAVFFSQSDNALDCPEIIQNCISKEFADDIIAGRTDGFRLFETPLGILEFPGDGRRRHVFIDSGIGAWFLKPGMGGNELQIRIEFDGIVRCPKPELFVRQRVRCRVIGFFKLNMAVAVDFDLTPGGHLDWDIRQEF